jgi:hypothetical protein
VSSQPSGYQYAEDGTGEENHRDDADHPTVSEYLGEARLIAAFDPRKR